MNYSMNWKLKREIAEKYNASANIYDILYREEQEAKIKSALKHVQLKNSDLVLDVGCGTGILFRHIKKHIGFLVGLDLSKNLLKKALHKAKNSPNITLILADADYMPFISGSFDKVFAVTLLQNIPNIKMTLQEINRVTRKNALIIVTGLKKAFKQEDFLTLLSKAGLKILSLKASDHLLGYVAVCRKE